MSRWKVLFDEDGNHVSSRKFYNNKVPLKEVEPFKFRACLRYTTYYPTKSGIEVYWEDIETDKEYVSSFLLINQASIAGAVKKENFWGNLILDGEFTFYKAGNKTYIKLVEDGIRNQK